MSSLISYILGIFWITIVAAYPINTATVPEMQGCTYLNAYEVNCWWKRTHQDTNQYKLGYFSAADSFEERRERFCAVTEQRIEDDVIIESCGIHSSMYERLTLFVTRVQDCDVTTGGCTILAKSEETEFTCMSSNVKLTLPPTTLNIEPTSHKLSWEPPEHDDSMLSFVLHRRHVLYKVEYREIIEVNKQSDWMEWYNGYKTSVFLPTLVPGATYEVRNYASLDPPKSYFSVTSPQPAEPRDWTSPSNILVFLVPRNLPFQAYKNIEINELDQTEQTTSSSIVGPIRPIHVSRRIIIASSVAAFVIVLIIAIAGYFLPWKQWCCCLIDVNNPKPKIMLDIDDVYNAESSSVNYGDSEDPEPEETFHPIPHVVNFESERNKSKNETRGNKTDYFKLEFENCSNSDYGRQRLIFATPSKGTEDSFSLNDLLDRDASFSDVTSNDERSCDDYKSLGNIVTNTKKMGEEEWDMSQSKQELRTLLSNCGALAKDTPIRYVKFHQTSNEDMTSSEDIPSYLMSSEQDGTLAETRSDRSSSDYVIDDTGIESMLTNTISDVTDMTSYDGEEEEKHKQWQKYIMSPDQSEYSDDHSDDIPDYVMHAPPLPKDFCQNMTMFVSLATEDVSKRKPLNIYDVTKYPLKCHDKDVKLRHSDVNSSRFIVMTMCPSCKSSQKHECCPNENSAEELLAIPAINNRRGSVSDNSVDSGYSPDSPDCVIAPPSDKVDILGSRFELKCDAQSVEDESDNDEYMKYVMS